MVKYENIEHLQSAETVNYLRKVPYDIAPAELYDSSTLFENYRVGDSTSLSECYDQRVYQHVLATGKMADDPKEMLGRCLHDYNIKKAVRKFVDLYDKLSVIGIMGGHAMSRADKNYYATAYVSKKLTESGCLMISGGGPGAMEASHLGAWMAGRTDKELEDAVAILAKAPLFTSEGWFDTAYEVTTLYPRLAESNSLAVPTWFYGHEPPTIFASHIAKFFDNSIREDLIITEAYGGLIYMPGAAGTMQELFQEAVQDHYNIFGFPSPIILYGKHYWTEEMPAYPFLQQVIKNGKYKNLLLSLMDTPDEVLEFFKGHHESMKG